MKLSFAVPKFVVVATIAAKLGARTYRNKSSYNRSFQLPPTDPPASSFDQSLSMAGSTKKRQQLSSSSRQVDLSHMTRPKLDPLVQQTLESVGMRTRKALSDAMYKKEMSAPLARHSMKLAIMSNAEIAKPRPFYEIDSAKDPWASFREAGRRAAAESGNRTAKRARDEDNIQYLSQDAVEPAVPSVADMPDMSDPNDLEFTNPPWLVLFLPSHSEAY